MRDHTSLGDADRSSHGKQSDPRLSILTRDALFKVARSRRPPSVCNRSNRGQFDSAFGQTFFKGSFLAQQLERMRHMRRATMVMAVLAFLPRARCCR